MAKNYGVVIPDENLFSYVQKITFSNRSYGFYVETGLGCELVFPDGRTNYDVQFLDEQRKEAYTPEDAAYIVFRDGRIYAVESEWVDLRDVCDEWNYIEGFFTLDMSEPVFVEREEFERAFSLFQNTIFYEPCVNYAEFITHREFVDSVKKLNR